MAAINEKYKKVSTGAEGLFKYPTGAEGAFELGYNPDLLKLMPESILTSFCGVGNPFSVGKLTVGSSVLDIGCGAGFDLLVAVNIVGPKGWVCGVDITTEMLTRAKTMITDLFLTNVEVGETAVDELPYPDFSFDCVISNGVINLSPVKQKLFKEIFRVLKPGGRFQFADIILSHELPLGMGRDIDGWAQ